MNILVTGGAGYIGTHTIIELINNGHAVVAIDNLVNSTVESIFRVQAIVGRSFPFYKIDIRDRSALEAIFKKYSFDCCIHFAGLKVVGESVIHPWEYYENNVNGTLVLLDVMRQFGCKSIIFSSSATVYGNPSVMPITENCPKGDCTNPYGRTKSIIEDILFDMYKAEIEGKEEYPWNIVILRYFNPIGAHPSGLIGEAPNGTPNNLMPNITLVAAGKRDELHIFGNDYETPDGTGIRDYIHVVDLAKAHVKALQAIQGTNGVKIFNLGTGKGYSVLEVVHAFEKANGVKIPYIIEQRRKGDIALCYSDPRKANNELGWKAEYDIFDMCRDSWNWLKNNPDGYIERLD